MNPKKLVAPTTSMVCLGILVNTETRTMYVPPKKIENIIQMCAEWQSKEYCSKGELQSLLESLLYVSKCVRPARTFLNRMLQFLRSMGGNSSTMLTAEFFKDLKWFATFFKQFNGVVYYDVKPVQAELHLDACLTGFGGIFDNQCYALHIPKNFINYSIVHLEMLNIETCCTYTGLKNQQKICKNQSGQKVSKSMPCVYYNDNSCNFQKHHETKGVFYPHICSTCFAQDGKISVHSALDSKSKN